MSMTTEHTALTRSICAPADHLLVGSSDAYPYGLWVARAAPDDDRCNFYVVEGEAGEAIGFVATYARARELAIDWLKGPVLVA